MPKDDKAVRTPSFRAKLSQMQGVSPEEKALFQRIGNLVDTLSYTQRQTSNPRVRRRTVSSNIPAPGNVQGNLIVGGVQVSWDPVNIKELDFYEVQFSESSTFAQNTPLQVIATNVTIKGVPDGGTLFVRVRTVTKRGEVSNFTSTTSVGFALANFTFLGDQDQIEPENRTTVLPKPTLLGTTIRTQGGARVFSGIGAYVGPSPATISDTFAGQAGNQDIKNEITYTSYETASAYPGLEQRLGPTIGEYIDEDAFYTYDDSFYIRFITLPASFSDFFQLASPSLDPTSIDNEFLRYRLIGDFYFPNFNQSGYVFSATLGAIIF